MADYDADTAVWYYLKDGRQLGPVPERSIRAWLESGFLSGDDLLWRTGLAEWTPVGVLSEFGGVGVPAGAPPRVQVTEGNGEKSSELNPGAHLPEIRSEQHDQMELAAPMAPTSAIGSVRYGGFWLRLGAFVIDNLVVNALVSPILLVQMKPGQEINPWEPDPLVAAAFVIVYLLYGALTESSPWQATLGKRAWRIRVTNLDGERISPTQALVRQVAKIVSVLGFGLGFLMAAISPRKQALHDWLSGCVVVKE